MIRLSPTVRKNSSRPARDKTGMKPPAFEICHFPPMAGESAHVDFGFRIRDALGFAKPPLLRNAFHRGDRVTPGRANPEHTVVPAINEMAPVGEPSGMNGSGSEGQGRHGVMLPIIDPDVLAGGIHNSQ